MPSTPVNINLTKDNNSDYLVQHVNSNYAYSIITPYPIGESKTPDKTQKLTINNNDNTLWCGNFSVINYELNSEEVKSGEYTIPVGSKVKIYGNSHAKYDLHVIGDYNNRNNWGDAGDSKGVAFTMPDGPVTLTLNRYDKPDSYGVTSNTSAVTLEPLTSETLTLTNSAGNYWGGPRSTVDFQDESKIVTPRVYDIPTGKIVEIYGNEHAPHKLYAYQDGGLLSDSGNHYVTEQADSQGFSFKMPNSPLVLDLGFDNTKGYNIGVKSGAVILNKLSKSAANGAVENQTLTITNINTSGWGGSGSTINYDGFIDTLKVKSYSIPAGETVRIYGNNKTQQNRPISGGGNNKTLTATSGIQFTMPNGPVSLNLNYQTYGAQVTNGTVDINSILGSFSNPGQTRTLTIVNNDTNFWCGVNSVINYGNTTSKLSATTYTIPVGETVRVYGNDHVVHDLYTQGDYINAATQAKIGASKGVQFRMPDENITLTLANYNTNSYKATSSTTGAKLEALTVEMLTINDIDTKHWGNSEDSIISYGEIHDPIKTVTYYVPAGEDVLIYGNDFTPLKLYAYENGGCMPEVGSHYITDKAEAYGVKFKMPNNTVALSLKYANDASIYAIGVDEGTIEFEAIKDITQPLTITNMYTGLWGGANSTINYGNTSNIVKEITYRIPVGQDVTIYGTEHIARDLYTSAYGGTVTGGGKKLSRASGVQFKMPDEPLKLALDYNNKNAYAVRVYEGEVELINPTHETLIVSDINVTYWGGTADSTISYTDTMKQVGKTSYQIPIGDTVRIYGNGHSIPRLYVKQDGGIITDGDHYITDEDGAQGVQFTMPDSLLNIQLGYTNPTSTVNVKAGTANLGKITKTLTINELDSEHWGATDNSVIAYDKEVTKVQKKSYEIPVGDTVHIMGNNLATHDLTAIAGEGTVTNGAGNKGPSKGLQFTMPTESVEVTLGYNTDTDSYTITVDKGEIEITAALEQILTVSSVNSSYWSGNYSTVDYGDASLAAKATTYLIPIGETVLIYGNEYKPNKVYANQGEFGRIEGGNHYVTDKADACGIEFTMPVKPVTMELTNGNGGYQVNVTKGAAGFKAIPVNTLVINSKHSALWGETDSNIVYGSRSTVVTNTTYYVPTGKVVKIYGNTQTSRPLYVYEDGGTIPNGTGNKGNSKGIQFTMPSNDITMDLTYETSDSYYRVNVTQGTVELSKLVN